METVMTDMAPKSGASLKFRGAAKKVQSSVQASRALVAMGAMQAAGKDPTSVLEVGARPLKTFCIG